ncbi:VOC family protein [Nocardioides dongkuii]|uniref:VOC family protein n=1 Tax=Nocardioides dongkuii TaxID=2760089 RepID=UPI0015FC9163|nr:VOC family protein [Nocardioides dongkuii]
MPIARYKDLCLDAVDTLALGRFWAGALGRRLEDRGGGLRVLTGPTPRHTVWVNPVPEPVTVKQRVHLDVHARSVGEVLALGAEPADLDSFPWAVLRDPEGGELCVFEREQVPDERLYEVVVDAADPHGVAAWWADVLGVPPHAADDGSWYLQDVPGLPFECFVFVPVPEPKTVKNRVHVDVDVDDPASLEALVARGARVVRRQDDEIGWTVLADPEGNEFCAFVGDDDGA